jgi:hypothetical protein
MSRTPRGNNRTFDQEVTSSRIGQKPGCVKLEAPLALIAHYGQPGSYENGVAHLTRLT